MRRRALASVLILSSLILTLWMASSFRMALAQEPTTLADNLRGVISNVNWTYGNSWTTNWGMILAGKGEGAFDEAIAADLVRGDYLDALYVARLAELNGYSSETVSNAIRTALQQIAMVGSLPLTTNDAIGDPNVVNNGSYLVYHRFALWGYEYAEQLGLADKWNISRAFKDFAKAYDSKPEGSVSGEMLWIDPQENWAKSYSSRYYDEHAQTLGVFLKFAEQGVQNATAYVDSAWNGVQAHWNTQYGYYGYTGTSIVECEMGNFAQIIAEYKNQKGGTIPYWDRVLQDLNYKLLASNWSSPGWAAPGVIAHAQTNPQLRLWETMGATIALQELFPDFTTAMKLAWSDMLMGSRPAWRGLVDSSLNQGGYFRGVSGGTITNDATAAAAATLFLEGIVPITGSLAIPNREEYCSDLRTPFAASNFTFDYGSSKIRIPVKAGEITFIYGSLPVSYNFTADGVYDIEFRSDWNQIKSINGQYVALTPSEPLDFKAAEGNASISLSWSPPQWNGSAQVTNYRIYRGNTSGTELLFKEVGNILSYADTEVTIGKPYFYRITAGNSFGQSEFSNETSATVSQPATADSYDGLWHTSDFSIILNGSDPSGVAETYYKINDGVTLGVKVNGQPFISSESGGNTLEYWSADAVGNEELPHKMLTQIKLDKTPPTGSIQINDGASFTTSTSVRFTLEATDASSGVYRVRVSDDGVWDTETWENPLSSKTWVLTGGDGEKTVYYQIKDNVGLVSTTFFDTVTLDTVAPQGSLVINTGAVFTNSTVVDLGLQATDYISGVSKMRFSTDNSTWTDWEPYAGIKTYSLQNGDGAKNVIVQYKDNAGQVSSSNSSIFLDTAVPLANPGQNQTAIVGSLLFFNASDSLDNTAIVSYVWTFGDGTNATGVTANHTYSRSGAYLVELTVQDAAGNRGRATIKITIEDLFPWLLLSPVMVGVALAAVGMTAFMITKKRKRRKFASVNRQQSSVLDLSNVTWKLLQLVV